LAAKQTAALNRTQQATFLESLERELDGSLERDCLGLLLVQLRDFGRLNFAYGYRAMDAALAQIATRLVGAFDRRIPVVRIGTRKFAILLRGLKGESHASLAAKKVQRLGEKPLEIGGPRLRVDVVQGIALYPAHASTAEGLLRCAEAALSVAGEREEPIVVYTPTAASELAQRHEVDNALADALEVGRIEPYFQPQIDIRTGAPSGAEALLRCRDDRGAFIAPELVVRAAERTHRLAELTAAVLDSSLRHATEWPVGGRRLSVNLSTESLKDRDLVPSIRAALGIWGWPPGALTVEITETAMMGEPRTCFSTMRQLRDLGVRVAIDDFGTGYSSLAYFKDIPANELKVDKCFVLNVSDDEADRKIVETVIGLAHAFGFKVVAEGVESAPCLETLRRMDCDFAQGHVVGRPMSSAAFAGWLERHDRLNADARA
jgi:diguanylate cyclase (GGDEF)-like protein